jgi:hypothetical protein
MEKIVFSDTVHVYRTKLNMSEFKSELLEICDEVVKKQPKVITDGFGYNMITRDIDFVGDVVLKNKLDEVIQRGISSCIEIYNSEVGEHNLIETDGWVNIVRAKDPVQGNFKEGKEKYHIHSEINKKQNTFEPTYTYVYYIQMPNNLKNDDGVLYFKDKNDVEFSILPEEDDLIIMCSDVPHAPNKANDSTLDRIVFAGNVGIRFVKKNKSII